MAGGCGVPLGLSVESLSGFREEIDGCFELFRRLQATMLDSVCSPWAVRWYRVPVHSMARSHSEEQLAADAGPEMAEEEQAGGGGTSGRLDLDSGIVRCLGRRAEGRYEVAGA